jgi:hypothetical protein
MSLYGAFRYGTNLLASLTRPATDTRAAAAADDFAVDCSSPTAQDGTENSAEWANEVTVNLRGLVRANGSTVAGAPVVAETGGDTQLLLGVQNYVQRGRATYCVDSGAADAYVITPTPTPPEILDGMEFLIEFSAANATIAPTLTCPGLTGAKTIKNSAGGALAAADIIANAARVRWNAGSGFWRVAGLVASQLPSGAALRYKNLLINNSSTSVVNVTADWLFGVANFSASINSATSGAGGLDTGALAASAAYDLYAGVIGATGAQTAWMTLEGNAPTVPSGVTTYMRVGWQRTDSSKNFYSLIQRDDEWWYQVVASGPNTTALPVLSTGAVGSITTGATTAVSLAGAIPSKSIAVDVVFGGSASSGNDTLLAPNANYGGANYASSAPPYTSSGYNASTQSSFSRARIMFEAPPTLYIAAQSNAASFISGGKINI